MSSVSSISTPTLTVGSDGNVTAGNLVNNLDTTSIINALMTAAAVPQTQLEAKITAEQTNLTDYQTLNQSIQALATTAQNDTASHAMNLLTATSSDSSITATASTSASASQLSLQVDQVAQSQISVSAELGTWADASGNITIVNVSGTDTQITSASTSLSDVVSAINAANAGVTASAISVGSDSSGNPLYRLQLTATSSGTAGAFQIYAGSTADVAAGTATNLLTQSGAATISTAQDAKVTLWPGTSAAADITSSSNTFANLMPGLTVNVTAPTAQPATITTTQDSSDIANLASTLVSSITSILQYIAAQQAGTTTTKTDGSTSFTAGAFTGDSTIRGIATSLQQALSSPVGTNISPSTYGISIQEDGTVTFDQATFEASLASDPTDTLNALQTITQRVSDAATEASDPYTGSLTSSIQSQQTQITTDQTAVTNWTSILADKKATLTTEYSNLVNTLSQLQSEQQYLTQQITMMDNQNNNN